MIRALLRRARDWFLAERVRSARAEFVQERAAAYRVLELAAQKLVACEGLWAQGHAAEGYNLLRRSEDLLERTVATVVGEDGTLPDRLRHLHIAVDRATLAALTRQRPAEPQLMREVTQQIYDDYDAIAPVLPRVLEDLHDLLGPDRRLQKLRAKRIGGLFFVLAVACAVLVWAVRPGPAVSFSASNVMGDGRSAPENAMDGMPATSWQMENGQLGSLDMRLRTPKRISRIWLTNDINSPWNDRATRAYRIELLKDGAVRRTLHGEFSFTTNPRPVGVEVPGGVEADSVRFVVESFFEVGAGLAEIRWE